MTNLVYTSMLSPRGQYYLCIFNHEESDDPILTFPTPLEKITLFSAICVKQQETLCN